MHPKYEKGYIMLFPLCVNSLCRHTYMYCLETRNTSFIILNCEIELTDILMDIKEGTWCRNNLWNELCGNFEMEYFWVDCNVLYTTRYTNNENITGSDGLLLRNDSYHWILIEQPVESKMIFTFNLVPRKRFREAFLRY